MRATNQAAATGTHETNTVQPKQKNQNYPPESSTSVNYPISYNYA
jgi:hypothetical protein